MLKRLFRGGIAWSGLAVSVAAVVWLVRTYDWHGTLETVWGADWAWLAVAPALLLPNFALRAMRWRALFPEGMQPRLVGAFAATMVGYLFNNLLPARAGELVRIHMIGKREQLPRSAALGTVVVERTLDLLVLLALLAFVLFSQSLPGWAAHAGKMVAALALAALGCIVLLGLLGEWAIGFAVHLLGFLPPRITQRLDVSGRAFISGVSAVLRASHLVYFFALSAATWALELLLVYTLAQAFGLNLGYINLLFVMLAIALGTMVPASPGYIGTFEFFGVSALSLLGITGSTALGFVVTLHAILLLGSSLVGTACVIWYGWPRLPSETDPSRPGDVS